MYVPNKQGCYIILGWEGLPGTNKLSYSYQSIQLSSFIKIVAFLILQLLFIIYRPWGPSDAVWYSPLRPGVDVVKCFSFVIDIPDT